MLAATFDLVSLQTGSPQPVLDSMWRVWWGHPHLAISANGTVAYLSGPDRRVTTPIWFERGTKQFVPTGLPPGRWRTPRISPDGEHFVIALQEATTNLRLYSVADGRFLGNMTDGMNGVFPVWWDNKCIVFMSDTNADASKSPGALMKCIGGGEARAVPARGAAGLVAIPYSRSPGNLIAFEIWHPNNAGDIWVTALGESAQAQPFVTGVSDDVIPVFSPNGRYIAYSSDRTGLFEMYVERYPPTADRWLVTPGTAHSEYGHPTAKKSSTVSAIRSAVSPWTPVARTSATVKIP
jgi:hypothetical protein